MICANTDHYVNTLSTIKKEKKKKKKVVQREKKMFKVSRKVFVNMAKKFKVNK